VTIALGPWAWPDRPSNYTNISDADRWNLRRWGGGVPYLGYAWANGLANWIPDNWVWLAEHGYRECVLRLWFDGASSDNPQAPPSPQAALDSVAAQVEAPVRAGIQLIGCQIENEPDLERRGAISPADYAAWCLEFIRLWRAKFPAYPLISPPLAQESPDWAAWVTALEPVVAACDYQGVHYYFGRHAGDQDAGAPYSPEAMHDKYADKPVIVTECGNASVQHDLAPVLRRWASYPWLRSYHVFVLSSPGFPQWNYTEATGNVLNDLIREWREQRRYPTGASVIPPVVSPPANYDTEHLRVSRALLERIRQRVEAASAAVGGIDSDAQEAIDRLTMAGLQ
jgi:hypothetical protein